MSRAALAAAVARELRAMRCDHLAAIFEAGEGSYVPELAIWPVRVLVAHCRVLCVDVGELLEGVTEWTK